MPDLSILSGFTAEELNDALLARIDVEIASLTEKLIPLQKRRDECMGFKLRQPPSVPMPANLHVEPTTSATAVRRGGPPKTGVADLVRQVMYGVDEFNHTYVFNGVRQLNQELVDSDPRSIARTLSTFKSRGEIEVVRKGADGTFQYRVLRKRHPAASISFSTQAEPSADSDDNHSGEQLFGDRFPAQP